MEQLPADRLRELITNYLREQGLQLVELQLRKAKAKSFIKALIDKECGGITVEECAKANEEIGLLLDKANLVTESYLLEVSSPGIDRPLVTEEDFKRNKGKTVKIELLTSPGEKAQEFTGIIEGCEDNAVVIGVVGQRHKIPLNAIRKAKIKVVGER